MDTKDQDAIEASSGAFFYREAVSGVLWMVASKAILFFVYFSISVLTLFVLGVIYSSLFFVAIRMFKLLRDEDIADFRDLNIKKLNFVFNLLSPQKK